MINRLQGSVQCAIALFASLAGCGSPPPNEPNKPREPSVRIVRDLVDIGIVESGRKVTTDFVIDNSTQRSITINEIRGSCSCVVGGELPIVVPPAAIQGIPFFVSTVGKREGGFSATVRVVIAEADDTKVHEFQVVGQVEANRILRCKPPSAYFAVDTSAQRDACTIRVELVHVDLDDWDDVRVTCPEWLDVDISERAADFSSFALSIRVGARNLTGIVYGEVVLSSKTDCFERAVVPVTANYIGRFVSQPLNIVSFDPSPQRFVVRPLVTDDRPFEFSRVHIEGCPDRVVDAKLERVDRESIALTITPCDDRAKVIKGVCSVAIRDDMGDHEIRVPFVFLRRN